LRIYLLVEHYLPEDRTEDRQCHSVSVNARDVRRVCGANR